MLEWYRVGDSYEQGRALLNEFAESILEVPTARQVSYREIFSEIAGLDPFSASMAELGAIVTERVPTSSFSTDRDELLNLLLNSKSYPMGNLLMSRIVEPQLAEMESLIIHDWPESQAALAKTRSTETHTVAERFELYVRGVELANGYHELLDADELLRRNVKVNQLRLEDGNSELPAQSRLLAAMEHGLPACSGTALGFDRLAMLALGKESIAEVIPFGFDRA